MAEGNILENKVLLEFDHSGFTVRVSGLLGPGMQQYFVIGDLSKLNNMLVHGMQPKLFQEKEWAMFLGQLVNQAGLRKQEYTRDMAPIWVSAERAAAVLSLSTNLPSLYERLDFANTELWNRFDKSSQCEKEIPSSVAKIPLSSPWVTLELVPTSLTGCARIQVSKGVHCSLSSQSSLPLTIPPFHPLVPLPFLPLVPLPFHPLAPPLPPPRSPPLPPPRSPPPTLSRPPFPLSLLPWNHWSELHAWPDAEFHMAGRWITHLTCECCFPTWSRSSMISSSLGSPVLRQRVGVGRQGFHLEISLCLCG